VFCVTVSQITNTVPSEVQTIDRGPRFHPADIQMYHRHCSHCCLMLLAGAVISFAFSSSSHHPVISFAFFLSSHHPVISFAFSSSSHHPVISYALSSSFEFARVDGVRTHPCCSADAVQRHLIEFSFAFSSSSHHRVVSPRCSSCPRPSNSPESLEFAPDQILPQTLLNGI